MKSKRFELGRALALGLLLLAPITARPLQAVAPPPLTWYRLPSHCRGAVADGVVACGENRVYAFRPPPAGFTTSGCNPLFSVTENVRLYPTDSGSLQAGSPFPCSDRRCLTALPVAAPWVALIDWQNQHGLTVAETLGRVAKGMPVQLFPLDAPEAVELLGDQVGDAHVLMQLCAIAEQAEVLPPPQLVNLSFGRYLAPAANLPTPGLETEIRDLVAELTKKTHFVAAAGNDGLALFPAAIPEVLAVGALDLAAFRQGQIQKSHISPLADAYFPAYGLLLESGTDAVWPPPPGTSYASAIAAGWLAELLVRQPELGTLFEPGRASLFPRSVGSGLFELAAGSDSVPDSANTVGSRLLEIAAFSKMETWQKLEPGQGPAPPQQVLGIADKLPSRTWTEVRGRANSPAPDSYPCVPCVNSPDPWGGGGLEAGPLQLDFGRAADFGPEVALVGYYLQSGNLNLRLTDSENPALLQALSAGLVTRLTVEGLPEDFRDHELLLVWVLHQNSDPTEWTFVHRSPITLVTWKSSGP